MEAVSPRIQVLQEQGYSLSHASAMATVEWALSPDTWKPSRSWCHCCGNCWQGVGVPPIHEDDCPIPALGYAVMKGLHWYCVREIFPGYPTACDGTHEPRPEEL